MTWFKNNLENIKAFIKLTIPMAILFVAIKSMPFVMKYWSQRLFNVETVGVVTSFSSKDVIKESLEGGFVTKMSYEINYEYHVNDELLLGLTTFFRSEISLKEKNYLEHLNIGDSVSVFYKNDDKSKNRMKINLTSANK